MAVAVMLVIGILVTIYDYGASKHEITEGIQRNPSGQGVKQEELEVDTGTGERKKISVEISEQMYGEKETEEMFQRCIKKLEKEILGENKSLDRIETDMNFLTELSGEPVEISWSLDRYDVMNVYGEIQKDNLTKEGTLVHIEAVLTYTQKQDRQSVYQCAAVVFPQTLSKEEALLQKVKDEIEKENEQTQTKKQLNLPTSVNGNTLSFYREMNDRGIIFILMAIAIAVLIYAQEIQNQGKKLQEKRKQMMLDYPEILNKLTLFIGAGMTTKRAWKKIVTEYESGKHIWGVRYAYEEMKVVCREMESGRTEAESYERFGKRCNLQEYIRLGALLSQNIRKGTKGMNEVLRLEAIQAFENRKSFAKKAGEEAGTKLLIPMFIMFAIVLIMVIVPAILTMQV